MERFAMVANKLTDRDIRQAPEPGNYADGEGLYPRQPLLGCFARHGN
jgi:hypothetical protein